MEADSRKNPMASLQSRSDPRLRPEEIDGGSHMEIPCPDLKNEVRFPPGFPCNSVDSSNERHPMPLSDASLVIKGYEEAVKRCKFPLQDEFIGWSLGATPPGWKRHEHTTTCIGDGSFQLLRPHNVVMKNDQSYQCPMIARTTGGQLPEELIISKILSRLPVKSLMRFKSVCKSWQFIICGGEPHLITLHLRLSRQQLCAIVLPADEHGSGVVSFKFMQARSSNYCQSEFQHMPHIEAVASSCMPSHFDGLILFSSAAKLHVCNPATRELVTLPTSSNLNNPSKDQAMFRPYNAAALGLDPYTNKYMVVRFFYRTSDSHARTCSLGVEVLTLGSPSLCWIPTEQEPPYPIWPRWNPSTAEGIICWLIDNTLHGSSPQAIISFDLKNKEFGVIPPPPTWSRNLEDFQNQAFLNVLDGELCCTHRTGPMRHACIYRQGTWQHRYSVNLDVNKQLMRASLPLGTSYDGKILLKVDKSFIYYDPQTQTTELIMGSTDTWPSHSKGESWFHGIPYTESLLPIKNNMS